MSAAAASPLVSDRRHGYRGYIASRPVRGTFVPQHVQNLVIRDYARRKGLTFKLSATEYAMPGCYMMLADVIAELAQLEGMVCYSMFMLPQREERRLDVYRQVLAAGATLHAAVEDIVLADADDVARFEDIIRVEQVVAQAALGF